MDSNINNSNESLGLENAVHIPIVALIKVITKSAILIVDFILKK